MSTVKKWRCTVCGYIHEGPEPPDVCPVCGAPKEKFVEVADVAVAQQEGPVEMPPGDLAGALNSLSYGLFVLTSRKDGRLNGQMCNTVAQVTSDPPRIVLGINKQNLTHEFIQASGVLAATVLAKDNMDLVPRFGYQSGRKADKFAGIDFTVGEKTGCPILPQGIAFLEARIIPNFVADAGTHTVFLADVVSGGVMRKAEPMTYREYRALKGKGAPAQTPAAGPVSALAPATASPSVSQEDRDVDRRDVIAALNLEFGANRRYQYQIETTTDPRLASLLRGVMLTEGDHVDAALRYLTRDLERDGWTKTLLDLKLNRDFEETARDTYLKFASEVRDPELARIFREQAQSEQGHVNIFDALIKEIEAGTRPVVLWCPLCGWEVDFGARPELGETMRCARCGASVELGVEDGRWTAKLVRSTR